MKKAKSLICLLFPLFGIHASAQNSLSFNDLHAPYDGKTKFVADSLLMVGQFEEAIAVYKTSNTIKHHNTNLYQIAVAFCMLAQSDSAEIYLRQAIEQGYFYDYGSFQTDPYLQCLKQSEHYETLANTIDLNYTKKFQNVDTALQNLLIAARNLDQRGLNLSVRKANMHLLDSLINARKQWIGYDIAGYQGAQAAWLIAQHADDFVEFQERCLILLNEALKAGNAHPHHVAYLYDRIQINKGGKQQFGTQNVGSNTVIFINLDAPEHVDIRRRSYDLQSLESYRQALMRWYGLGE